MNLSYQTLIEAACDITTVVEADGRIVYDSPAVERVLGYGQGELVGRNAFELVHPDDLGRALALLVETVAAPERTASLTFRFRHREGGWRWLASVGRALPGGDAPRLVVTSREVSARRDAGPPPGCGAPSPEVEAVHVEMLDRLALAAEFRDDDTGQHIRRVGELSAALAREVGLKRDQVEVIGRAAPLHDVGKIGIRDSILLKPGPLSGEEQEVMRTHTLLGARLLSSGRSAMVREAEAIALRHHERWDGRGYPGGLRGEEIPLPARVVSIVDYYDALTHDRPYRPAWPRALVVHSLHEESGTRFDPALTAAFLHLVEQAPPA